MLYRAFVAMLCNVPKSSAEAVTLHTNCYFDLCSKMKSRLDASDCRSVGPRFTFQLQEAGRGCMVKLTWGKVTERWEGIPSCEAAGNTVNAHRRQ